MDQRGDDCYECCSGFCHEGEVVRVGDDSVHGPVQEHGDVTLQAEVVLLVEDAHDFADDQVEQQTGLLTSFFEPGHHGDGHEREAEVKEGGGALQPQHLVELLEVAKALDAQFGHQLEVDAGLGLLDVDEGHVLHGTPLLVDSGGLEVVVDCCVAAALADEAVLEFACE